MNVSAAIGKGRMTPEHIAAARILNRLEQPRLADLLETFGREPAQDQLTLIVPHKHSILLLNEKYRRKRPRLAGHSITLPNAITRFRIQAAQLPFAAQTVDVIALPHRRGHGGVQ